MNFLNGDLYRFFDVIFLFNWSFVSFNHLLELKEFRTTEESFFFQAGGALTIIWMIFRIVDYYYRIKLRRDEIKKLKNGTK